MANYPIKVLVDEKGQEFIPISSTDALLDSTGQNLDTILASKLETNSIIAGSGITLNKNTTNHTVEINCSLPGASVIDNLTTTTAGQGSLDAHQGYVLNTTKINISDIVNNVTSTDADKPLSAYQGYLLSNRIPNKISDLTNDSGFVTSNYHDNTKVDKDSIARVNNVVSRNLANTNNYSLGHINMSNGGIEEDNNWAYTKVKIKPNTQYTYQLTSTENQEYEVAQYQSNGTYIVGNFGNWTSGKQSYTFTTSNNTDYILIAWRNDLSHSNIQVEEGSATTDYVPYLNLEEAMQENDIYSTSEQRVGTWINGKPIYRKIIARDRLQTNNGNIIQIKDINLEEIVKLDGVVSDRNGGNYICYSLNTPVDDTNSYDNSKIFTFYDRGNLVSYVGEWRTLTKKYDIRIILEYTKTTD